MKIKGLEHEFIVIGENIHTTRVLLRRNKRLVVDSNGAEGISYEDQKGNTRSLVIPEIIKQTQDYQEGRIKHLKAAIQLAMLDNCDAGLDYIEAIVTQQEEAGADYLDINVDEFSLNKTEQINAMQWLVKFVTDVSTRPLSIDSSDVDVIAAGLEAYDGRNGAPLLNSASMERPTALDLAREHRAAVIVTASGESAMPEGAEGRINNGTAMIEAAIGKGISTGDIFLDPLVFPVSVHPDYGRHCLEAIKIIRQRFGKEIHITGGFSNASFGIPARSFVNEAFMRLAVEAGADSGIMDPVLNDPVTALNPGQLTLGVEMATDVVLGNDADCAKFIKAWRLKELK